MLLAPLTSSAQWITQSITIKPGWTAIYLHVDASYDTLDNLVAGDETNPIDQVWLWQPPASTLQFTTTPQAPLSNSGQWLNWARTNAFTPANLFNALVPNSACLVHSSAATTYTWNLKGKPAPPQYSWSTTGLNLLGFPTPAAQPPMFDSFLLPAPAFTGGASGSAEIYAYSGGDLGPNNPALLFNWHSTPVTRGQAFWMRTGTTYNNYFGPFQVSLQNASGVAFADNVSQYSFSLANLTASNLVVSLQLLASEAPPAGQPGNAGVPPLLLRGPQNLANLTYTYSALALGGTASWTLAPAGQPGSQIAVVLGLNRYAMGTNAAAATSALFAGLLRLTDALGFEQVDLPVSASVAASTGLWVGNASVTQVRNDLTDAVRDAGGQPVYATNGTSYLMTNINNSLGGVIQPYPLRLIVHNSGANVTLLQRVFLGLDPSSNSILTTSQSLLDQTRLATAHRISAVHLPWSQTNIAWPFTGQFAPGGTLSVTVPLDFADQASNPFLHTYHPDHDNLDATFQNQLPVGAESFSLSRAITLTITPPGDDFTSLTAAGQSFSGNYNETITLTGLGGYQRSFAVAGAFALNRISRIPILSRPAP